MSSCVINNGLSSSSFNLERGVRQGDPLSPYLFVVAIEILTISLRLNDSIKGIKIDDDETKFLAYADDITAILPDISSARKLFVIISKRSCITSFLTAPMCKPFGIGLLVGGPIWLVKI